MICSGYLHSQDSLMLYIRYGIWRYCIHSHFRCVYLMSVPMAVHGMCRREDDNRMSVMAYVQRALGAALTNPSFVTYLYFHKI